MEIPQVFPLYLQSVLLDQTYAVLSHLLLQHVDVWDLLDGAQQVLVVQEDLLLELPALLLFNPVFLIKLSTEKQ